MNDFEKIEFWVPFLCRQGPLFAQNWVPFLEFLGPLEIGDIVWNTAGLTGGARCSSATVHPGPVKKKHPVHVLSLVQSTI